jgi:hypothetical protein
MKTRSTNQILKSSTRHKLARSSEVNRAAGASNQPRVAGSRFLAAAPYHRVPRCGTVTGGNPRGCTGAWACDPARRADEAIRIWMGPWRWFCSLHRGDACGGPNRRCNRAHIDHGLHVTLLSAAAFAGLLAPQPRRRILAASATEQPTRGRPNVIANWRGFAVSSSWRPWCWAATPCTTALR